MGTTNNSFHRIRELFQQVESRIETIHCEVEMSRVEDEVTEFGRNILMLLHEQVGDEPNSDSPPKE